jgi:hypothetical protein
VTGGGWKQTRRPLEANQLTAGLGGAMLQTGSDLRSGPVLVISDAIF